LLVSALTDDPQRWRVRSDHPTSAAGAQVLAWRVIVREIGIMRNGDAGSVLAPPGKVLASIRYLDGWPASIVLFFPRDFVQSRERKQLKE
jgi:hypothetical protein